MVKDYEQAGGEGRESWAERIFREGQGGGVGSLTRSWEEVG
jgi:hypothetical protein